MMRIQPQRFNVGFYGLRARASACSARRAAPPLRASPQHCALRRSAFTLVELLFVSVVLAIAVVLGVVLTQSGVFVWERTDLQLTAMADAQRAMDRVTEDLRVASRGSVTTCSQAAGLTFRIVNPDGTLTPSITYTRAGTQLLRTPFAAASQVVAEHITLFAPVCQAGGVVWLRVSAQPPTTKASLGAIQALSSKVWMKNI